MLPRTKNRGTTHKPPFLVLPRTKNRGTTHPMSQRSYMWNNNNPVQYSDPSGYLPQFNLDGVPNFGTGDSSDSNSDFWSSNPSQADIESRIADDQKMINFWAGFGAVAGLGAVGLEIGAVGGVGFEAATGEGPLAIGDYNALDYSATRAGSEYLNSTPNMTSTEFIDNLSANGFSNSMAANGATTLMRNGDALYSVYARTSTGELGAQYQFSNPTVVNGNTYIGIKFLFNGP